MEPSLNTWGHILGKKSASRHPHRLAPTGDEIVHKGGGGVARLPTCLSLSFGPCLCLCLLVPVWGSSAHTHGGIQGTALPPFSSSKGCLWCPLVHLCSSHCYTIWTPRCPLKGMGIGFNQIKSDVYNTHREKPCAGWSPCLSHHPNLIEFRLTQYIEGKEKAKSPN